VKPALKRMAADYLRESYDVGLRRSCGLVQLATSSYYYEPKGRDDAALGEILKQKAQ